MSTIQITNQTRMIVGHEAGRKLAVLDGLDLPDDTADILTDAIARAENVTKFKVTTPPTADALAQAVLAKGTVPKDQLLAASAGDVAGRVFAAAKRQAQSEVEQALRDTLDECIQAVAVQRHAPAVDALLDAVELWDGRTPGQLFEAGQHDDARNLQSAVEAHTRLVSAYEDRRVLRTSPGVNSPADYPCSYARPHEEHNAPTVGRGGVVVDWPQTVAFYRVKDFGTCMHLLAEGVELWCPTTDEAAQAQAETVADINRGSTEDREYPEPVITRG